MFARDALRGNGLSVIAADVSPRSSSSEMMLSAPDVALTDFGLAIEAGLLAYLLWQDSHRDRRLKRWFALLFLVTSIGASAGGTVHGFFPDERSPSERILWPISLIALGAGAMAAWAIGALIGIPEKWSRRIIRAAQAEFLLYAGAILALGLRSFGAAVLNYLPATIFLFTVFARCWFATHKRGFLLGAIAMVLTFVAAGVQQSRLDLGGKYLSYNALYHLIQAAALLILFAGARRINGDGEPVTSYGLSRG